MTTIADTAYKKLQDLPIELQQQALDFIEFIEQKQILSCQKIKASDAEYHTFDSSKRKLGFMRGQGAFPDDINWGDAEIEAMFYESLEQSI